MRLDRLVKPKELQTSAPDIRLAHPPCTTDSECMVNNNIAMSTFHRFRMISFYYLKFHLKLLYFCRHSWEMMGDVDLKESAT